LSLGFYFFALKTQSKSYPDNGGKTRLQQSNLSAETRSRSLTLSG